MKFLLGTKHSTSNKWALGGELKISLGTRSKALVIDLATSSLSGTFSLRDYDTITAKIRIWKSADSTIQTS